MKKQEGIFTNQNRKPYVSKWEINWPPWLGRKKGALIYTPDITEIDMNEEFKFIVMGSDGIFDVLSNGEINECIKIVIKINEGKNSKINQLCRDFSSMIIKSSLAKEFFDNISCIVIVFNLNDFSEK